MVIVTGYDCNGSSGESSADILRCKNYQQKAAEQMEEGYRGGRRHHLYFLDVVVVGITVGNAVILLINSALS